MRRLLFAIAVCLSAASPCWPTITLGQESVLPAYAGFPMMPRISGNYVASLQNEKDTGCSSPSKGVYVYSLSSGKAYTAYKGQTGWCDIWGDLAGWTAQSTTVQGMMSLKSEKKAFTSQTDNLILVNIKTWEYYVPPLGKSGPAFGPAICQNYVAYEGANNQIYLMDLNNGEWSQITKDGTDNCMPDIGPDLVAWTETVKGKYQMRAYRISTSETINLTDNIKGNHHGPISTDGRYVVWYDSNYDMGLYDTVKRAVIPVKTQGFYPSVGNGIIAYQKWLDKKSAATFAYDIAAEKEIRVSKGCSDSGPRVDNGRMLWTMDGKMYWVPFSIEK